MPLPPITVISDAIKSIGLTILGQYNDMQTSGATDTAPPLVDNLIVSSEKAQILGQSGEPLFYPLDRYDSYLSEQNRAELNISKESAVYRQLGDNGLMPMFFSILNGIGRYLTRSKWVVGTRIRYGYASGLSAGNDHFFLNAAAPGDLPHSTRHEDPTYPVLQAGQAGETGVPVDTGGDAASLNAVYVELLNASTGLPLTNLAGTLRVFGRTSATGATPGNSVRINLFARGFGADPTNPMSVLTYNFESGLPTTINVCYGYRQRLDELDDVAFRRVFR